MDEEVLAELQLGPEARDLLIRTADAIDAHPENFNMRHWALSHITAPKGLPVPACGTAACGGGWTLLTAGWRPIYGSLSSRVGADLTARIAVGWERPEGEDALSTHHALEQTLGTAWSPQVCDFDRFYAPNSLWHTMWLDAPAMAALMRQWVILSTEPNWEGWLVASFEAVAKRRRGQVEKKLVSA